MVNMFQGKVFQLQDTGQFFFQLFRIEQLVDLHTDLGKLVGEEGSDPGFGGTKGGSAKTFFLVLIQKDVVRKHDLRPVGDHKMRFYPVGL